MRAPNPAMAGVGPADGIAVENATVTYRNGTTAVRDASFRVPTGTVTALVGVNGSGKSTLFRAIMGFVPVARGSITILGEPLMAPARERRFAVGARREQADRNQRGRLRGKVTVTSQQNTRIEPPVGAHPFGWQMDRMTAFVIANTDIASRTRHPPANVAPTTSNSSTSSRPPSSADTSSNDSVGHSYTKRETS